MLILSVLPYCLESKWNHCQRVYFEKESIAVIDIDYQDYQTYFERISRRANRKHLIDQLFEGPFLSELFKKSFVRMFPRSNGFRFIVV